MDKLRNFLLYLAGAIIVLALANSWGIIKFDSQKLRQFNLGLPSLKSITTNPAVKLNVGTQTVKLLNEESVVTDAVDKVSPSVVTVAVSNPQQIIDPNSYNFFSPFDILPGQNQSPPSPKNEQDIGTGFILSADGTIVTNKHVVGDSEVKYVIITKDDKKLDVKNIYRDPANDLAILKVDPGGNVLKPIELGDSSKLKVGQLAIAIGTALGEFRQTVTTGVVSGLGRVITAGDPFQGVQEKLDNLIQTDAAINPGNSGGPLLNSSGQAIGVSVAVSQGGQNIGFALPINLVKDVVNNFNQTGKFSRPYLGIRYTEITRQLALINQVPQGAYVRQVVENSPAQIAGVKVGDIINKIDNELVSDANGGLAGIISKKKVGDKISMTVFRANQEINLTAVLAESSG